MFRVVLLGCVVFLTGIALTLYLSPSAAPADFVYANSSDLNTLDPAQMSWTKDIRVAINLWEGLTSHHPRTAEPIEGAAQFPPHVSSNGLTYTFTIRSDARWSNGDPVTAEDFIRGWRRAMEPGTAMDYVGFFLDNIDGAREYYEFRTGAVAVLTVLSRLARGETPDQRGRSALAGAAGVPAYGSANVDWAAVHRQWLESHGREADRQFASAGIETPEPSKLIVRLRRPCPYFLDLCAFPTLFPIHGSIEVLRERFENGDFNREGLAVYDPQWTKPDYHARDYPGLITNGPFRLAEWSLKRRLRLVRNDCFRAADTPACHVIDCLVYGDVNTAIMAYEAGNVDFLPEMQVDYDHRLIELATSGARPDFQNPVVMATHYYIYNCAAPEVGGRPNPFVDRRVRKAFNLAIDKRLLVENVLKRGDPVVDQLVPPGMCAGYPSPPGLGYDPSAARLLLVEAGYPGGNGLPVIDLAFPTTLNDEKTCEVLARMWQSELGVRVELRGKEPKTFAEDKVRGRYMIARAGWYGDYRDPTTFLNIFRTGDGNNDPKYSNPDYDQLIARAERETHAERRFDLLAAAESKLIREDCPVLPLYQRTNLMAIKPHVHGLWPNLRLIFPFRYVSVTR